MNVAILKYNAGNVRSVSFALERLGVSPMITDDPNELLSADKVIFPGVGEASTAMRYLKERKLDDVIISLKQPVLGICLGMQLMCKYSEEGNTTCMGIFDLDVRKFDENDLPEGLKIPHMGWNTIQGLQSKLFKGVEQNSYMYFVHSFYAGVGENTIAKTDHGIVYSSALQKNNFYATQFHPEKSGVTGQLILKNFIEL